MLSKTEEAKSQAAQIEAQSQIQVEQAKSQFGMEKLERETQLEIQLLYIKSQLEAEAAGMKFSHEDNQNNKKRIGDAQIAVSKSGPGGVGSDISVGNKANTVDGKVRTGGLL